MNCAIDRRTDLRNLIGIWICRTGFILLTDFRKPFYSLKMSASIE